MLHDFFQQLWYSGRLRWVALLLAPLSWAFALLSGLRRQAYRAGVFRTVRVARPVIVIGNISVGGVGKTPLTIWLASRLAQRNLRVGVVLRGYGGRSRRWPRLATPNSCSQEVGDEAVLIATRTSAVVVAGPDRVADAELAIEQGVDVVICDDGLQHYRLARDCEIVVIDELRGLGNGRLLPAGPLREPPRRLRSADLIVWTRRSRAGCGAAVPPTPGPSITVRAKLGEAINLATGEPRALQCFKGGPLFAVAAIGHPEAFFESLRDAGLTVEGRAFPDHAQLTPGDLRFPGGQPVLMTEKDAVKCRAFDDRRLLERLWAVRMDIEMGERDAEVFLSIVERALDGAPAR